MSILRAEKLNKKYKRINAVNNVSFSIEKGQIMGLIGSNGAGKSTLIRMLSTLEKPDSGNIYFKDELINTNMQMYRRSIGYVPQKIALFEDLRVFDNLQFFGSMYGMEGEFLNNIIKSISKQVGLHDVLYRKTKNLSGGMMRRVNLSAALLHKPDILILDEPTAGIDYKSIDKIFRLLKELSETGITIFVASHNIYLMNEICNNIIELDSGKTVRKSIIA